MNGRLLPALPLLPLLVISLLAVTADRAGVAGEVQHVVLIWLADPGNRQHVEEIVDASIVLAQLPGVESLRIGEALASERAVVDSSYDLALVFTFADAAALNRYLTHPDHRAATERTLRPRVARMQVYDFRARSRE